MHCTFSTLLWEVRSPRNVVAAAAFGSGVRELLQSRLAPAAKLGPPVEGRRAVVVGEPQGQVTAVAVRCGAEDRCPLACGRVNAALQALVLAGLDETFVEGLVRRMTAGPVLGALDVEPKSLDVDLVLLPVAQQIRHLTRSSAARGAREHVGVHVHASRVGSSRGACAGGINFADAFVAANDGILEVETFQALEGGFAVRLADVHPVVVRGEVDHRRVHRLAPTVVCVIVRGRVAVLVLTAEECSVDGDNSGSSRCKECGFGNRRHCDTESKVAVYNGCQ